MPPLPLDELNTITNGVPPPAVVVDGADVVNEIIALPLREEPYDPVT
jgi:hypothetical protein